MRTHSPKHKDDRGKDEGYFDAAQKSFARVWQNRFLWFWGIFLPSGLFSSLNYLPSPSHPEKMPKLSLEWLKNILLQSRYAYLADKMEAVIAVSLLAILVMFFVYWMLSAVARSGVIKTLDLVQNNQAIRDYSVFNVGRSGKPEMGPIMQLDILIFGSLLIIFSALAVPIVIVSYKATPQSAALLSLVAFMIFAPLLFLGMFLRNIGVIHIVLAKQKLAAAIEVSYLQLLKNMGEAVKLFMVVLFLAVFEMMAILVAFAFLAAVFMAVSLTATVSRVSSPSEIRLVLTLVFILMAIGAYLWIHSLFALWIQDIWLWWARKFGGIKAEEVVEEEKRLLLEKTEPAVGR